MRVIVLGSELNALSTAYHLAEIGYEVTVITQNFDQKNKNKSIPLLRKKMPHVFEPQISLSSVKNHIYDIHGNNEEGEDLFVQTVQKRASQLGVHFRHDCKVEKFITQNKRVRGMCLINKYNQEEILIADKFVVAIKHNYLSALKPLGLELSKSVEIIRHFSHQKIVMGQTCYSNLYLNLTHNGSGKETVAKSGKILAEFIYNPSSEASYFCQLTAEKAHYYMNTTLSTHYRIALH